MQAHHDTTDERSSCPMYLRSCWQEDQDDSLAATIYSNVARDRLRRSNLACSRHAIAMVAIDYTQCAEASEGSLSRHTYVSDDNYFSSVLRLSSPGAASYARPGACSQNKHGISQGIQMTRAVSTVKMGTPRRRSQTRQPALIIINFVWEEGSPQ